MNKGVVGQEQIIFTGGNGLLGREMKNLLPKAAFTTRENFDICNYDQMAQFVTTGDYRVLIHAAAMTSPPKVDQDSLGAMEANIVGTANVVKLCACNDLRLIYICTDYVFPGDKGNYAEDDPVLPVNKYAWSKLGGECAARMYDKSLVVRTTFGPNEFPYEKAFVDQWTSRQSVAQIAEKLVRLVDSDLTGVIHVGGPRQTVFDFAKALNPEKQIGELYRDDVSFSVPLDTSMNCQKYTELFLSD